MKKNLMLGTLMACLITGNVAAAVYTEPSSIDKESDGTYYFKAGSYDDLLLVDLWMEQGKPDCNIVLNVEDNDTITVERNGSYAIIDIYAGDCRPENTAQATFAINGNIDLTVDARGNSGRSDVRAINLLNNHDTLTINGDTKISIIGADVSVGNTARAAYDGIRVYSGKMQYNGDFELNKLTFNRVDESSADSYVTGVYSTTTGGRVLGFNVEVGDDENNFIPAEYSEIILGADSEDTVTVQNIEADNKKGWLSVVGIHSEGENSLITVNGDAVIQNITSNSINDNTEAIAIQAISGGQVDVKGDLTIKDIEGTGITNYVTALTAYDGGVLNVNEAESTNVVIDITGDIDGGDSVDGSVLNINLMNNDSSITGASTGNVNMILDNGAVWNVEDRHLVNDTTYDNDKDGKTYYKWSYVNTLTGASADNYGIVNLNIDASKVNSADNNRLFIEDTHSGTHYITLDNIDTSDVYNAAGTVLVSVYNEEGVFLAKPDEGTLYWNKYTLDRLDTEDGEDVTNGYNTDWILAEVEQTDEPTTSVDTILGANALNYHTWIMESDKLMKRMGDLRHNGEDEQGAWFRVRGSKISRDDSAAFENKYTTYELGYDTLDKETEDYKRYAGASISYSDGTSSYERGSGENSGKAISFYSTTMRNKGHYLDFVFKVVDMDNDFSVFDTNGNNISGAMDNQGISVNVEYGRKKDLGDKWYIEPQSQLIFGYLGGDNYKLNNGIAVDQGGISSLVGRIGFNIGRDIDEKTNLYLKANLLHEFLGDYSLDMTDTATGDVLRKDGSFGDTWGEIGIGAAIQTGKNNHIYFDVEKTFGGDFEKDWAWNAGMRWTF